jgi:AcrR family transcriptional regulator
MKTKSRREQNRAELRAQILQAAREAALGKGFESLSMRALAEKLGCSHGNLYLHFKTKEQLFDCLVEESFAQLAATMRSLRQTMPDTDPVEFLKLAGRAYVEFGLRNPGAYEFAFILRRPGRQRRLKPHRAYLDLQAIVARCVEEKRFGPIDVDAASQAVWAAAHGITSLFILRPGFPWADKETLIRQVIDSAIDSLVADRPG